jgi:hypothetical protein
MRSFPVRPSIRAVALAWLLLTPVPHAAGGGFAPVGFYGQTWVETQPGPGQGLTMFIARAVFEIDPAPLGGTAESLDGVRMCFQGHTPGPSLFWPPPPAERLHAAYDFCRDANALLTYCNRIPAGRIGLAFGGCAGTASASFNEQTCLADLQATYAGYDFKARKATQAEVDANACSDAPVASFGATAAAAPAEVQLEDAAAVITVTVTLQNTGTDALTNLAPAGDPAVSGGGEVEKTSGPTPASVDLAAGASATITYTFKPTKAGPVTLTFASFGGQSSTGPIDSGGPVETNQVLVKEDVTIEVKLEPASLATDSSAASGGIIRAKVTNAKGEPSKGRRVRIKFPQYYLGPIDFEPRVLICTTDGSLVFPPGANPIPLDAAFATTPDSGEVTFQLWVGTQRRSDAMLVTADAVEEDGTLLATDGDTTALGPIGGSLAPSLAARLNETQQAQLPEAQRLDAAGITGRAAPLEVLQSLVRWLSVERERGLSHLQGIDFVPITSQDQTNAGVLFYARGELQALLARLQGTPTAVGALVLQVEVSQLDPLGRHEVLWLGGLMPLDTWETTRPLNTFGIEDQGRPVRGPAVAAVGLVTASPYAFLGYPYPTAGAPAAGGYGGGCVPALNGVGVEVHSPVALLVKDAQGHGVGHDASGVYVNDVPGAVYDAGEPATYLLPPGSYQTDIVGTDKGPATLVLSAPGATSTFTLKAKAGKTGTISFDHTLASATGTFNKKKLKGGAGVPITVAGVKKRIKVRSGDPLTLTVTNPFGAPVAGARVHATGNGFDAETLTGADGVATMPLVVTKATKKLTVTVDGAGVQPKTLKLKVKLLKS